MSATLELLAPFDGPTVPLSRAPDPVFAGLMMGDGLAIEPLSGTLLAPCDGEVAQLVRTGHALTLRAANGAEVLIHVGIDTVKLDGEGFKPLIKAGDAVRQGQPLIEVDLDAVARRAPSLLTMVVIANGEAYALEQRATGMQQAGRSVFLTLSGGAAADEGPSASGAESRGQATVRHAGGLHARPAALVQNAARQYRASVRVEFKGQAANARSVVALMGLGVSEDDDVAVLAQGEDAAAAAAAVIAALQTRTESGHGASAPLAGALARALPAGWIGGVCAAPGLAIGQVVRLDAFEPQVAEFAVNADSEREQLRRALAEVSAGIAAAIDEALRRGQTSQSDIFAAHLALVDDPELRDAAERDIAAGHSAGHAFRQAVRAQCRVLSGLGSPLLAERVADLKDIERQVLKALLGDAQSEPELYPASILVAEDLAPSELTRLPRERVAGILSAAGGATGHVAILARALGIPALVACGPQVLRLDAGGEVLLDASQGGCDPAPSAAALASARQTMAERERRRADMRADADGAAVTLDGVRVEVAANIANEEDAREAVRHGADSVGLLRTEFLFIDRRDAPDRYEQANAYQAVLDELQGRVAIIRTLDVGGDKEVPYLTLPPEPNPALGLRGIRTGFAHPEMLDEQLRALLMLRPLSLLRVLVPMIADLGELRRLRRRIDALAADMGLSERPQLGVMVEVPSAALLADQLAAEADFLSIGTNDLTQYTLAMDRCNASLAASLDAMHPALLRLIERTVAGASQHGKWVGVCGALASDPLAAPVLVGLGVAELSVSPGLVPEIKARVRTLDQQACRKRAEQLLTLDSAAAVRAQAAAWWPES
ncbi:phosphoenolpyruvate-protein phosphotransferase [Chromobacterium alkanivorans]|uniref:phosphoenolpyruvate--protein phosphotransferase n=1 Tax=Chromobacterium alkanivorans TaxID=1071719 RepID=UPI002168751A|nr:phosphoenolpyruvate--protein phosphotransferase [Chromobacterium alkanivorans]MCS3803376.1 phosphoenolpyruvate-protein phosphotransferase [Chromobacterium alkanivorans]MCS3817514.1 phosphoenolpyruvate-protein phosphotransferase [Chromobacterium alkanivorans]MCS3872742.1 phosphoenolpyruvate-protein phosphotransferase [Chromobacterium alkanivorans]